MEENVKYKNMHVSEEEIDKAFKFTNKLVKELEIKLWREMIKKGNVYSYDHCEWVKRKRAKRLDCKILDPVEEIKKHSPVALMRRMKAEGKVYSVTYNVWVKKELEHKLPGAIIDPDEKLKRYDSGLEKMRV